MTVGDAYYSAGDVWARSQHTEPQIERARATVELLPDGIASALDVGCGTGVVTQLLAERVGKTTVALDFELSVLAGVARPAICGLAERLPLDTRSVDATVIAEVLEHLGQGQAEAALREIRRVTREHVVISVPYREVLRLRQLRCAECGCVFHADRHADSFDEKRLSSLLEPEFRCLSTRLVGRRDTVIPDLVMRLAQAGGVYMDAGGDFCVCPQCGNQRRFDPGSKLARRLLLGLPLRLLSPWKRPRWIAALYARRQPNR